MKIFKPALAVFLSILLIFSVSGFAFAHGGATDDNGGHYNHSTGEYHYHHGYSAHQHENGECPYDFNDQTNHSPGTGSGSSSYSSNQSSVSVAAESLSLNYSGHPWFNVGDTFTLKFEVFPEAAGANIIWSSGDEEVFLVDQGGFVTVVGSGEGNIFVTDPISGLEDCITLYVNKLQAETVEISPSGDQNLKPGDILQLSVSTYPEAASEYIEWISENENVATVSANGLVTAANFGETYIKARDTLGGESCSVHITVKKLAQSINILSGNDISLSVGKTKQLDVEIFPSDSDSNIVWRSTDKSVAEVSQTGVVTATGSGLAMISASDTVSGNRSTLYITVTDPMQIFEIISENLTFTLISIPFCLLILRWILKGVVNAWKDFKDGTKEERIRLLKVFFSTVAIVVVSLLNIYLCAKYQVYENIFYTVLVLAVLAFMVLLFVKARTVFWGIMVFYAIFAVFGLIFPPREDMMFIFPTFQFFVM